MKLRTTKKFIVAECGKQPCLTTDNVSLSFVPAIHFGGQSPPLN